MSMQQYDVIILTQKEYINPVQKNEYIQNVLLEDELIQNALEALDLRVKRVSWDDYNFDWTTTKYAIFRATWDYFNRFTEFSQWLEQVSKQTTLLNSEATIRWNIDKHYLYDLHRKGIHVAETYFIEKGTFTTLKDLHKKLGWKEMVLKPCVSGAARHTYKLDTKNLEAHESIFNELISNESMMLQPFQKNIVEKGEISMMVFNGEFTHAILKIAKPGDFRVQDDFGGSIYDYVPTNDEIEYAENCVKACSEIPMYARVDIFEDNDGKIALAELELIEPELWFRKYPKAAQVLANAINERI
jgi:glutathione synthase/RimK-type ligase-like ATP-grasp enzyme